MTFNSRNTKQKILKIFFQTFQFLLLLYHISGEQFLQSEFFATVQSIEPRINACSRSAVTWFIFNLHRKKYLLFILDLYGGEVARLIANCSSGFKSGSSPAHGNLCQSLGGLLSRMTQYHVLPSEGCRGTHNTQKNLNIQEKKHITIVACDIKVTVPDHDGGRPKEINAWFLYTHMVYL
jgi:hypothetical protein